VHPSHRAVRPRAYRAILAVVALAVPSSLAAQWSLPSLQAAARRASPEVRAAQAAVAEAAGLARQSGALANPVLSWAREQTSREDGGIEQENAQDIVQLEQHLELPGRRSLRSEAAGLRAAAAEANLADVAGRLDVTVAAAFARAVEGDHRERITARSAADFDRARRVAAARLAAGDESAYAGRRLTLEAARAAVLHAEATLARRQARVALALLLGLDASAGDTLSLGNPFAMRSAAEAPSGELAELTAMALRQRPDVAAAALGSRAAVLDATLAARERVPSATVSAGLKRERVADPTLGSQPGFNGLVLGVAVPLPLFDRRAGAVAARDAASRRATEEEAAVRRRAIQEVADALGAWRAVQAQLALLDTHLGAEAMAALVAVDALYAEGEISLTEWLDARGAYRDAELAALALRAEESVRAARLARALGTGSPSTLSGR
jgi:cobalt-zinc-cadmium efflux system outer membrane protein